MSYSVKGTTITMTRGDSLIVDISITEMDGYPYAPVEGDSVRFAMKKNVKDTEVLLYKDIPIDTMRLTLDPEDTKNLDYGTYVYDVQLTKVSGVVDTFITKSQLILTEEVD